MQFGLKFNGFKRTLNKLNKTKRLFLKIDNINTVLGLRKNIFLWIFVTSYTLKIKNSFKSLIAE